MNTEQCSMAPPLVGGVFSAALDMHVFSNGVEYLWEFRRQQVPSPMHVLARLSCSADLVWDSGLYSVNCILNKR